MFSDTRSRLMIPNLEPNTAQAIVSLWVSVSMPLLFVFVLLNFILAILTDFFEEEKAIAKEQSKQQRGLRDRKLLNAHKVLSRVARHLRAVKNAKSILEKWSGNKLGRFDANFYFPSKRGNYSALMLVLYP